MDQHQPIGFWLKAADRAIAEHSGRALEAEGLSRRHWQVLNLLARDGAVERVALAAAMRGFADGAALDRLLDDLTGRGWVAEAPGGLTLTAEGRAAHPRVAAVLEGTRRQAMAGIPEQDYVTVIRTLERVVANLGGSVSPPW